jgi:diguanylate cyclase (GGDEF)-like protein
MTLTRQLQALRLVLTCLLVLVAGSAPALANTEAAANGTQLQKVRVQLKWTHQFQFAGFYAAIEQGFFRNAGLDVELIEGGPLIDPVAVVAAGQAEFGVGTSSLLIDFNKGQPIMAVAAILQHSPFVILARRDPALRSVRDLEGKTLMGEAHSDELTAYLKTAGVPIDSVKIKPHSGDVVSLLGSEWDRVDAMTAYISTEPFEAARRNIPYQIFNPRDLNINFYGDTLFTSRQVALAQPHVVVAMRDALIAGWRYALAHQAEIVDLILRTYRPRMDRTELSLEAQATYNLFQNDLVDIGYMSRERWHSIGQVYAASGMLPKNFSLDGFMFAPEEVLPAWVYRVLVWAGLAIVAGGLLAAYIVSLNLRLAASLRTLGAQAEKLEAANNELGRLSTTDPLTGLFNRRYFDESLASELNRASRSGSAVSMLMVDIDHFKKYNDALGHPAGDACLKQVAEVLRRNAQRAGEFAARIGGEEFAVIASNLDAAGAQALAERILRDMAEMKIPHPATPLGLVTVSIGVSTLAGGADHTPQQLVDRADAALYRAKNEGRNRWATA